MLIEFSVANFKSFGERQTFSMVKSKGDEMGHTHSFKASSNSQLELLRSAAIYGPNAAGKSNFLKALKTMREIVLTSASTKQLGDKLPIIPCSWNNNPATEFEIIFFADGVRYQYGFIVTQERILEEWLYAFPKMKPQEWFYRKFNSSSKKYQWKLGSHLKGEKQVWQKTTRDNALFLSAAVNLNSEQLQDVYNWFREDFFITPRFFNEEVIGKYCNEKNNDKILKFLKIADVSINDIEIKKERFDSNELPSDMPSEIRNWIVKGRENKDFTKINTIHTNKEGKRIVLKIDDASDGTKVLFGFSIPWMLALESGGIVVVDELENSLHPKLLRFLINLFHDNEVNTKNAQLIFTTHNTSILNPKVFRRDQVWFCEKNKDHFSTLFPLTDFKPRKDVENFELSYLSGRYDALPRWEYEVVNAFGKLSNGE